MGAVERKNPFNQWRKDAGAQLYEIYDRFGRHVGKGDLVMLPAQGDVAWRVTDTKPILAADAPPGLVQITLAAVMIEGVQGGVPLPPIIKLRDVSEFPPVPQDAADTRQEEPESPPPPAPGLVDESGKPL